MAETRRLYFEDPFIREFSGRVVSRDDGAGGVAVVLDQTAFYPEGGGQLPDTGQIGEASVNDVQVDDAGVVRHVLDAEAPGELPDVGAEVRGLVHWPRRRTHMALHTGQHIVSRALVDLLGAETVSSRLGDSVCTIDTKRPKLSDADAARVEQLANDIIDDDVEVHAFFPDPGELEKLELRRAPKVEDRIRVVRIGEFDVTPCGGTHCTRSSQVGLVRVLGLERYKGGTRITFDAGPRVRRLLSDESALLRELGRKFTCAPAEVPRSIEKLERELDESRAALGKTRSRIADGVASELLARARAAGQQNVLAELDELGPDEARTVAARIATEPEAVALLAVPTEGGTQIIAMRGAASSFDCGKFLKRAAAIAGGRGGGRPERAEGRVPGTIDWNAVATQAMRES